MNNKGQTPLSLALSHLSDITIAAIRKAEQRPLNPLEQSISFSGNEIDPSEAPLQNISVENQTDEKSQRLAFIPFFQNYRLTHSGPWHPYSPSESSSHFIFASDGLVYGDLDSRFLNPQAPEYALPKPLKSVFTRILTHVNPLYWPLFPSPAYHKFKCSCDTAYRYIGVALVSATDDPIGQIDNFTLILF